MAFSIGFLSCPKRRANERYGRITIGRFQEDFIAPLIYWKSEDYERHWRDAVVRIVGRHRTSCLLTSIYDPATARFYFWWPMYRRGSRVFIQNHGLFLDQLDHPFDTNNVYGSVPRRITVNDEGERISEWETTVDDLRKFLRMKENVRPGRR
jgi:hypothetical protein